MFPEVRRSVVSISGSNSLGQSPVLSQIGMTLELKVIEQSAEKCRHCNASTFPLFYFPFQFKLIYGSEIELFGGPLLRTGSKKGYLDCIGLGVEDVCIGGSKGKSMLLEELWFS
jgi:hypothetical protein